MIPCMLCRHSEANNCSKSKDGKDRKGHVHQSLWYYSRLVSDVFNQFSNNFEIIMLPVLERAQ